MNGGGGTDAEAGAGALAGAIPGAIAAATGDMASREAWAVGEGWATNVTYFSKDSRAITTTGPYAACGVSMVVVMGRL